MIHDDFCLQRVLEPHNVSVDEDLREGAKQVEVCTSVQILYFCFCFHVWSSKVIHTRMFLDLKEQMRAKIELDPELLEQFAIGGKEADALEKSKISSSGGSSLHQYRDYQIF